MRQTGASMVLVYLLEGRGPVLCLSCVCLGPSLQRMQVLKPLGDWPSSDDLWHIPFCQRMESAGDADLFFNSVNSKERHVSAQLLE